MIKFQFFAASDPRAPSWDHRPGSQAALDPFGNIDAPATAKAIWEDSLAWMKGAPSPTRAVLDAAQLSALVETVKTPSVEQEQARIGAAYTLGQSAKGGDDRALEFLFRALLTPGKVEVRTTDRQGGKFAGIVGDPGDQILAMNRAGVWGLAAAGHAATSRLVAMLGSEDVAVLQRAAHALAESAELPDRASVAGLGAAMRRLRASIDLESEGLSLEDVKSEWRQAVFASREYQMRRRRPEWMALDIVAQALWTVTQRAVAKQAVEVYTDAKAVLSEFIKQDLNLPPQTRMNAAYAFISLSTAPWGIEDRSQLLAELGALTNDDDRYVMAAAVEAVRRLTALASPFTSDPAVLYGTAARHAVEARWCPVTNATAPF